MYSEQYLACADSTYYEDIQVLLKTLNHLLLSHAATPTQHWLVKFWNFLCSALGACFILFCPLKGHLMLWSWGCYCSVAKSGLTFWDPMDCSPSGSSVHGILQARILEWVAISFSRESSRPRDRTQVSRIPGRYFNLWATREAHGNFWNQGDTCDPVYKASL